jgi:hypothetical protein
VGKARFEGIPQIVAMAALSAEGKLGLNKAVRQHLGLQEGQGLFVSAQDEVTLSAKKEVGIEIPVEARGRVRMPAEALSKLGADPPALVGLVERPDGVAVKGVDIVEVEGERARLVDVETAQQITRRAETNPMPDVLIPRLEAQYRELELRYDVRAFLEGRQVLEAWQARQLLGIAGPADEALRQALIADRVQAQEGNGSWAGDVVLTARALRELAVLGLTGKDRAVQRAVDWLVNRPQSAYNPGMFFSTDALVEEQARIVADRKEGRGGRFRVLKTSEKKRVMAGHDLIRAPCGPRIMWPNALVLEALLSLGYEAYERVQRALRTMMAHDWCECGYQHGSSDWRRVKPLTKGDIETIEAACIAQFRLGGMSSVEALKEADLAHRSHVLRVSRASTVRGDEYLLRMPAHIQGCEFVTTRAMSRVTDDRMRRFARAHLWRFAGQQHAPNGEFDRESHGSGFEQAGMLDLFASYDHPASRVAILRSIPWIVETQNEDGSWGEGSRVDASTSAVVRALVSVGDHLPPGLLP